MYVLHVSGGGAMLEGRRSWPAHSCGLGARGKVEVKHIFQLTVTGAEGVLLRYRAKHKSPLIRCTTYFVAPKHHPRTSVLRIHPEPVRLTLNLYPTCKAGLSLI